MIGLSVVPTFFMIGMILSGFFLVLNGFGFMSRGDE
jgi:hypothetical protein